MDTRDGHESLITHFRHQYLFNTSSNHILSLLKNIYSLYMINIV